MNTESILELQRDVSATPEEFARALRAAFPHTLVERDMIFSASGADAAMQIELTPGPQRVIASLALPTIKVIIRFTAGCPKACADLLAHLDRYLHRGGG